MNVTLVLDKFRFELALNGVGGDDFAESIGITYSSYKNVIRDGAKVVPKWVLSFLYGKGWYFLEGELVEKKSNASHMKCYCGVGVDFGCGQMADNK